MKGRTLAALACYSAAIAFTRLGNLFDLAALKIQLERAVARMDTAEVEAIRIELEERHLRRTSQPHQPSETIR